jgi:hypothetical protein
VAILTALAVSACGTVACAADETRDFNRYKIIIDRAPFGAMSGTGADVQQPPFSARFTFIGTVEEDDQPLMAIILDKEGNHVHFKAEGESIGPVVVVKIEKAANAPAKLVLKQALEVATLTMESKAASGGPPPAIPQPAQPGQPPIAGGGQPGIRRIPFARGATK